MSSYQDLTHLLLQLDNSSSCRVHHELILLHKLWQLVHKNTLHRVELLILEQISSALVLKLWCVFFLLPAVPELTMSLQGSTF